LPPGVFRRGKLDKKTVHKGGFLFVNMERSGSV
jgi:hypothetical protein